MEMPFMGTHAAETFESGTFAAASGGTTMLVDFVLPGRRTGRCWRRWTTGTQVAPQISVDYSYHMAITDWNEKIFDEMAEVVRAASTPSSISWPTRAR
jgi:dihydropyrimidinase